MGWDDSCTKEMERRAAHSRGYLGNESHGFCGTGIVCWLWRFRWKVYKHMSRLSKLFQNSREALCPLGGLLVPYLDPGIVVYARIILNKEDCQIVRLEYCLTQPSPYPLIPKLYERMRFDTSQN